MTYRKNPGVGPNRRNCIPAQPVRDLVAAWIDQQGYDGHENQNGKAVADRQFLMPPLEILANRMGVKDPYGNYRNLKIAKWITLHVADKWLCAINRVDAWHTIPELNGAYNQAIPFEDAA